MDGLVARHAAAIILNQIIEKQAQLEFAFDNSCSQGELKSASAPDRNLCRAIITSALRHKGLIDEILRKYVDNWPNGLVANILAVAIVQIIFLRVPDHAAVSLANESTRTDRGSRHLVGFVNAILRRFLSDQGRIDSLIKKPGINAPKWLFSRWQRNYGSELAKQITKAHLGEAPLDITVKADPHFWAEKLNGTVLSGTSIRLTNHRGKIDLLDGFSEGTWWVQDYAASLPAKLLGNIQNKLVLDLCAAPGGKTAQLVLAGARVTALDDSPIRFERLTDNLKRLNLSVDTILADATTFKSGEKYDAILLDAPCSATGTLRRHPDIAWHRHEKQIKELSILQSKMLNNAVHLLKDDGMIVFSTCSLEPEEGEFHLKSIPDNLRLLPIQENELPDSRFLNMNGCLRTLPQWGLDGFFAARFKKR